MQPFRPNWLQATLLAISLFTLPAYADVQDDTERLFDAVEHLSFGAVEHREGNSAWTVNNEIRRATSKVRTAYWNLYYSNYRNTDVVDAVEVAYETLTDRYETASAKLETGLRCLTIALIELIDDQYVRQHEVKKFLHLAEFLVESHEHAAAKDVLEKVKASLRYGAINCPITTRGVRDAINFAIRKLSNRSLTDYQKEAYALDRIEVAFERLAAGGF